MPGAPPQEVRGHPSGSRSLRITWAPPPRDRQNGPIAYYKVKWLKVKDHPDPARGGATSDQSKARGGATGDQSESNGEEGDQSRATEVKVEADQRSYVIGGLEKWTEYSVWVAAGTEVGDGPPSPAILLRTDEDGM